MIYLILAVVVLVAGGFIMFYQKGKQIMKTEAFKERVAAVKKKKKIENEIKEKTNDEKKTISDDLWDN